MNFLQRAAYRHVRSFRREDGGLYALYVTVYSGIYRRHMLAAHRKGAHGRLMANGRCTWCGMGHFAQGGVIPNDPGPYGDSVPLFLRSGCRP